MARATSNGRRKKIQIDNARMAAALDEVARLLEEQDADRFRVDAYRRAASTLRAQADPVQTVFERHGLKGLERLPTIGPSIARSIGALVLTGRLPILDRLRGELDPTARLDRVGAPDVAGRTTAPAVPVSEILDVDREYRQRVAEHSLRRIAPRRFNASGVAWLPILHTRRGRRHYTVLFSNTAQAHKLGKTQDWVVLYADGPDGEHQYTVVTATRGRCAGYRVVRGRNTECDRALPTGRDAPTPAATKPEPPAQEPAGRAPADEPPLHHPAVSP